MRQRDDAAAFALMRLLPPS